jgi:hypothetical protein
LVVRYAGGIVVLWIGLAVLGLVYGFATVGSDQPEPALAGLGLGVISAFVAWFAARPVIVADRTGIEVLPLFGTRTAFRWSEVRSVGVRDVRRAAGRGPSLVVEATEDRSAQIDGLWVGATRGALEQIDASVAAFAMSIGVALRPDVGEPVDRPW